MKKALILFIVGFTVAVNAQPTNAPVRPQRSLESEAVRRARTNPPGARALKPSEITVGRLTYEGIAVEAIKTRRPLQLINPVAAPEYGSPEDNVARDPISGRVIGLKLFSIKF
jgi:hypothetical protein